MVLPEFSDFTVHTGHLGLLLKCRFCCGGSGLVPRVCISYRPPRCCSGITFEAAVIFHFLLSNLKGAVSALRHLGEAF